jgi:hypothetical protein
MKLKLIGVEKQRKKGRARKKIKQKMGGGEGEEAIEKQKHKKVTRSE